MSTPLTEQFIQHFGEMGSRWGINRTVGQIYALLVASPEPLCADDIVARLGVSRSNVSMSLKELDGWNLLSRTFVPGDRREFYTTPADAWDIFRRLAEQRLQREVLPTLSMLRDSLLSAPSDPADAHLRTRMQDMHDLIELLSGWFREAQTLDRKTLERLLKLGSGVVRLLEMTERISGRRDTMPPIQEIQDDG